jgi:transcriptional regulator with XRE-family HTH domain
MVFRKEEAIAFRKEFDFTEEELASRFHVTAEEIKGYENGASIPALILKRYQMFKYTGNETPEDFNDIGDFG